MLLPPHPKVLASPRTFVDALMHIDLLSISFFLPSGYGRILKLLVSIKKQLRQMRTAVFSEEK